MKRLWEFLKLLDFLLQEYRLEVTKTLPKSVIVSILVRQSMHWKQVTGLPRRGILFEF